MRRREGNASLAGDAGRWLRPERGRGQFVGVAGGRGKGLGARRSGGRWRAGPGGVLAAPGGAEVGGGVVGEGEKKSAIDAQ
jgi:hypothetical protein